MCAYTDLANRPGCQFPLASSWFEVGTTLNSRQHDTKGIGLELLWEVFLHDQGSTIEKVSSSFLPRDANI